MSISALDLLRSLDLIDASDNPADLSRFDDSSLRTALNSYYTARAQSLPHEVRAETAGRKTLSALRSSISCENGVADLLPSALVYDRTFVEDPLFSEAQEPHEATAAQNEYLGLRRTASPNRAAVAEKLAFFCSLAPLIRDRAVCVLPTDLLHKPPDELPIFFSPDGFASAVPEHIRSYVAESALVHDVRPSPEHGGLLLLEEAPSAPGRGISIAFKDDRLPGPAPIYFLYEIAEALPVGDGVLQVAQVLDWDNPPDEALYLAWVRQSVNRAALGRLSRVSAELQLAEALNSGYVTESGFEARLFALPAEKGLRADSRATAVNFLNANTPFIDVGSPEMVARLRRDNPSLFEKFQASLLQVSAQLTGVDRDFEDKAKQLYVKEVEPQVQAINAQLSKVRYQAAGSLLLSAAAIGLALLKVPGVPFSVMLTVAAGGALFQTVGGVLPSLGEHAQKKQTPAYIWSQIAKK